MSKLQQAVDYFYANPGCSKHFAAVKFDVASSNIYVALKKHDDDIAIYSSVGDDRLNAVNAWFGGNPGATIDAAAKQFGLPVNTLRAAYRGQAIVARRARLASGRVGADPVLEMREKCAKIAESIGGEHGAAIAEAIRSVEV